MHSEDAIHVIDDFLPDPYALRQAALEAEYLQAPVAETYAGRNSKLQYVVPNIDAQVARVTCQCLLPLPFPAAHARFRLCLANETGTGGVHIDNCHWTGVLFLTLDAQAQGGTDFFRHRPTGTLRAPIYPEDWAAWDGRTVDQFWKVVVTQTNDVSKWDLVRHVPMRFNRLVLFRPWLWHKASPGFGDSAVSGRLVYLLFYHEMR